MRIADFFCSRTASQGLGQRRLAPHELLQPAQHFVQVFKAMHALGASAQFAGRLRASQQQHAQDRRFRAGKVEYLLQAMLILGHASVCAAGGTGQPLVTQVAQRQPDGFFVKVRYRLAIVLLVAGIDQRIQ